MIRNSIPPFDFGWARSPMPCATRCSASPPKKWRRSPPSSTRPTASRGELWRKIGALGLHGITVEEEYRRSGLGYLEHVAPRLVLRLIQIIHDANQLIMPRT